VKWQSIGLVLSFSAGDYLQDPPQPNGEALYKELQEMLAASSPISANPAFETVNAEGVKSVR